MRAAIDTLGTRLRDMWLRRPSGNGSGGSVWRRMWNALFCDKREVGLSNGERTARARVAWVRRERERRDAEGIAARRPTDRKTSFLRRGGTRHWWDAERNDSISMTTRGTLTGEAQRELEGGMGSQKRQSSMNNLELKGEIDEDAAVGSVRDGADTKDVRKLPKVDEAMD